MKTCPFCAEEIQDAAIVCKHCGRSLAPGVASAPQPAAPTVIVQPVREINKGLAAVLSLIIPGAGQLYKGDTAAGILFLIFTPIGYLMLIIPGLVLHLFGVIHAATADLPAAALASNQIKCIDCGTVSLRGPRICPHCSHVYGQPKGVKE